MNLPYLNSANRKSQKQTIAFYGLNYSNNFKDGEFLECTGLSSSEFPYLTQREGYKAVKGLIEGKSLYARGSLCYVDGNALYYDGERIAKVSSDKKQFATINTKIVVFPDKIYYDTTEKQTKSLEATYEAVGNIQFNSNSLTVEEKVYFVKSEDVGTYSELTTENTFTVYEKAELNDKTGVITFSGEATKNVTELKKGDIFRDDNCAENEYNAVLSLVSEENGTYELDYTKNCVTSRTNSLFDTVFKVGDTIEISGLRELADNNGFHTIKGIEDYTLTFDKDIFNEGSETVAVTIKREVPDLDFICECDNRLWGVKDNTIYASALGDPTNFNTFDGLSTDSYTVAVGSDGDFTGCIAYSGSVLFFKENCVHKLLGSYPAQYEVYTYTIPGVQKGSDKSMCIINETLFYKGVEGVYAYNGGAPELISSNFGTRKYYDAVGSSYQNKYYISMRDELSRYSLYSYDLFRGIWLLEDNVQALDFAKLESTLYFLSDNKIMKMGEEEDEGGRIKWSATFCPIDELYHGKKGYSKIWLKVDLSAGAYIKAEVSVDNAPFKQVYLGHNDKQKSLQIPIKPQRCDSFKIRLSGEGRCVLKSMVREFYIGSEV